MSNNPPKSLSEQVFRPGNPVQELADRAAATVDLAASLRSALPAELAVVLRSASLAEDGTLVVTTTSPVWATRLRFHGETLLATCRARHPAVARVRIRVGGGTETAAIRPQ